VISFLKKEIGTLSYDSGIYEGHVLYTYGDAKVLINTGIQEGYMSGYLKGIVKWKTEVEFARCIVNSLGVKVRCDPRSAYPDVSPYSDLFVEVTRQGESLVEWG
jgi:hypothetical protein